MHERAGFIGLGAMGLPMTRHLSPAGHRGHGRVAPPPADRRRARGRRARGRWACGRRRSERCHNSLRARLARCRAGRRPTRAPRSVPARSSSTRRPSIPRSNANNTSALRRPARATSTRRCRGARWAPRSGTLTVMVGGDAAVLDTRPARDRTVRGADRARRRPRLRPGREARATSSSTRRRCSPSPRHRRWR